MGEGDDDAVPGADEPLELVLGLCDPACGDSRTLRLEAMRLPLWERVELGRVVQIDGEAFLVADPAYVVRLPDEVGGAIDGRDEIGRRLGVAASPSSVPRSGSTRSPRRSAAG